MEWKTDALVIRAVDYKESDRLLTLLTPEGKITAGIRGVRKPKAKLSFAAQPFCFAEYTLAQKAERNTVLSAYLYDSFYGIRTDVVKYYAACAVAEICDLLFIDQTDARAVLVAAVECLKGLAMTEQDGVELLVTFAIVALQESGYALDLEGCGVCGSELGGEPYFDLSLGCFTCGNCAQGVRAKKETYEFLRKCSGLTYEEVDFSESGKRALRLVRSYLIEKTEEEYPCLGELIRLL